MTFSTEQKAALAAPLLSANVKSRDQGGRKVSYIESWHVIAEANRIFGFDGWTRETVEIRCVSEHPREIGAQKHPGFGVTYVTKVRVTVGGVVREGCGAGHGIDRDLGLAHESAIKESESDAAKRALMTFGNAFGLALYDKTQANVADHAEPEQPTFLAEPDASKAKADLIAGVKACANPENLRAYINSAEFKTTHDQLPDAHYEEVKTSVKSRFPKKEKVA